MTVWMRRLIWRINSKWQVNSGHINDATIHKCNSKRWCICKFFCWKSTVKYTVNGHVFHTVWAYAVHCHRNNIIFAIYWLQNSHVELKANYHNRLKTFLHQDITHLMFYGNVACKIRKKGTINCLTALYNSSGNSLAMVITLEFFLIQYCLHSVILELSVLHRILIARWPVIVTRGRP